MLYFDLQRKVYITSKGNEMSAIEVEYRHWICIDGNEEALEKLIDREAPPEKGGPDAPAE